MNNRHIGKVCVSLNREDVGILPYGALIEAVLKKPAQISLANGGKVW